MSLANSSSLQRRPGRDRQRRVELELASLELFEQQVKRHDLGQRRRVARFVRVDLVQHQARFVVDHDVGIGRMITGAVDRARTGMVALGLDTRLRRIAAGSGNRQRCHETGKREPMRARDTSRTHCGAPSDRRANPSGE